MNTDNKYTTTNLPTLGDEFSQLSPGEELALRADAIAQGSPLGMIDFDEDELED